MQVGDLVKRADTTPVYIDAPNGSSPRCGIITKNEKQSTFDHRTPMFWVEWASGYQGWYYADELEVISESR